MQALHRLAVVLAALLVATFAMVGTASAQYPPEGAIDCSTSTTTAGSSFTCSAGGFKANSEVSVTANGSTTGSDTRSTQAAGQWTYETTTTADGDGVATAVIQVPDNATGSTRVTFAGLDPSNGTRVLTNADAVTVTQPGAGEGDPDPAPDAEDGTDGDLSATGTSATMPLLALAVLVLLGGAGLLAVARRRQRARVDA